MLFWVENDIFLWICLSLKNDVYFFNHDLLRNPDWETLYYTILNTKFKSVNKLFTLQMYYKLLKVPSYETQCYYSYPFCKEIICIEGHSNGSKTSCGSLLCLDVL
jgi:hypothetical protein